jgi:EAL domain-containing protein (putative c-di-GMP-specific phosphodiesterase class I)
MSIVDELTLTLPGLLAHLVRDACGWSANWRAITMHSAFQPVLSITHQRVVGYEALLRAHDSTGVPVTPDALFGATQSSVDARALDRLARCLHVANFVDQHVDTAWLFLNARPQVFETGWPNRSFIDELSAHFGLAHERIVIEVLEQPADDELAVATMLATSEPRDFLIAIDDFGTGLSNFDRVWRFRPDIVKIDRSLVARAASNANDEALFGHLVGMLHEAGTMVLAEGVETDEEMMVLMQADVDFVQGFWLGKPQQSVEAAAAPIPELIHSMWEKFADYQRTHTRTQRPGFAPLAEAALAGAQVFASTGDLALAAEPVFRVGDARRVFVTNHHGEQTLPSLAAPWVGPPSPRLAPLYPDSHSNWSRRTYFKHALAAPGRVAMMGPHYSLTDGDGCYTAAVAVERDGERYVFCAEFMPDPAKSGPR